MSLKRFPLRVDINFFGDRTIRVGKARVFRLSAALKASNLTSNVLKDSPGVCSRLIAKPRPVVYQDDRVRAEFGKRVAILRRVVARGLCTNDLENKLTFGSLVGGHFLIVRFNDLMKFSRDGQALTRL